MDDFRRERESIRWVVDDELYKFLSTIQACIAGGCITSIFTGQPIADIDIFFRKPEDYEKAKIYLNQCEMKKYRGTRAVCETDKAKTFAMTHNKKYCPQEVGYGLTYFRQNADEKEVVVQIVRDDVNCGEPEDIVNRFDITACQAAFDFKTDNFVMGSRFLQDNARRRIVINPETKNVMGTFYRIQKYIEKGYTVSPREYIKLAFMLSNKKYQTFKDFTDDLKICFGDPLIHHFYNKVRYPTGTRCEEKDSMMLNPFDPMVVVEWIEEFNVAGPHYPVKEGKDLTEEVNKDYAAPTFDEFGNIEPTKNRLDDFFGTILSTPQITPTKHPLFQGVKKAIAHKPVNPNDDDDDDEMPYDQMVKKVLDATKDNDNDFDIDFDDLEVECVKDQKHIIIQNKI